jgi:hypothetical protein
LACLIVATFFLLYSAWFFFYDGFVAWPNENAQIETVQRYRTDAQLLSDANAADRAAAELATLSRHTEIDLAIQRFLGVAFAVITLALLCVALWPRSKKTPPPPLPLPSSPLPPPPLSS